MEIHKPESKNLFRESRLFLGFIIGVCVTALSLYGAVVLQNRANLLAERTNQTPKTPQIPAAPPIEFIKKTTNDILVSAVIDNREKALPQKGIEHALVVWELATEGGITRLLSVFERSKLPIEIGPIRSARTYFNDIADAYGGVYLHSGGNVDALDELRTKTFSFLDLDEFRNGSSYFRSPKRKSPHNLFSRNHYLEAVITQNPERFTDTPRTVLFTTSDRVQSERGTPVKKIMVVGMGGDVIEFSWNGQGFIKREYGDTWGDEKGTPHVFDNVGILVAADTPAFDPFTPDSRSYDLESGGRFLLFRDQYAIEGEWSRNQKKEFIFNAKHSSDPLGFKNGKTLFVVVAQRLESTLVIETARLTKPIRIPILMYHYISETPEGSGEIRKDLSVHPELFRAQLKFLKDSGFTLLTFSNLLPLLNPKLPTTNYQLPTQPAILTFDDGYRDFYENAFPILKEFGFKAVVALPLEYQNGNLHLTLDQIKELDESGLVEFVSHSLHHIDLTDKKYSQKQLREEISDSKTKLEKLVRHTAPVFVYPSGNYNSGIIALVREAGYVAAVGTENGFTITDENLYHIPRLRVSGTETIDVFKRQVEQFVNQ